MKKVVFKYRIVFSDGLFSDDLTRVMEFSLLDTIMLSLDLNKLSCDKDADAPYYTNIYDKIVELERESFLRNGYEGYSKQRKQIIEETLNNFKIDLFEIDFINETNHTSSLTHHYKNNSDFSNKTCPNTGVNFDEFQQEIIKLDNGYHLVLAPPGSGKTRILSERVARAMKNNIPTSKMLCLTFTNRAARNMLDGINNTIQKSDLSKLFIGNVHRFCSHFLFQYDVVPKNTTIIDENERTNILTALNNQTESSIPNEFVQYHLDIINIQQAIEQVDSNIPEDIIEDSILHKYPFQLLCIKIGLEGPFYESLLKLYKDFSIITNIEIHEYSLKLSLQLLQFAKKYKLYKEQHHLLDFDDLLTKTYNYANLHSQEIEKYSWVQIDEVQDLSPLQFAIIDKFTEKEHITLYLGDEQQSIYSFIGAKIETLTHLKNRCANNFHNLHRNYRSPKYLLDIFNAYANMQLNIDPTFLPQAINYSKPNDDSLILLHCHDSIQEMKSVIKRVMDFNVSNSEERTAVLVPSNYMADQFSTQLTEHGIPHFKISGSDLFAQPPMQLICAHLQAVQLDTNINAWIKILQGCNLFHKYSDVIKFADEVQKKALCISDFLLYEHSSYLLELEKYCDGEYVIFDTETTGLDVFNDDIVQIAAIKVRRRKIVQKFDIMLETQKPIPLYLGDIENPLIQAYENAQKENTLCGRSDGLKAFLSFVGQSPIIGHNIEYDYHILDYNLQRECNIHNLTDLLPIYFDTLKTTRIIEPNLKCYKLKFLIREFHLDGENTHLANDDIIATKSVLDFCLDKFNPHEEIKCNFKKEQVNFINSNSAQIHLFSHYYRELYLKTLNNLYLKPVENKRSALVDEMKALYNTYILNKWIEPIDKMSYIFDFLDNDVLKEEKDKTLYEQLNKYLLDLSTYKEADLCDSSCIKENVFVSTIHKAKGLEFENVILYGVNDGTYPHYKALRMEEINESARLLYVGLSRAKKRLMITYSDHKIGLSKWGNDYSINQTPSRFLNFISKYFTYTEQME